MAPRLPNMNPDDLYPRMDLPRTLDQVFQAYLQRKQFDAQQGQIASQRQRQTAQDVLSYGFPAEAAAQPMEGNPWAEQIEAFMQRRSKMQGLEEQKAQREATGAGSTYNPQQIQAIMSGDPAALSEAFPGGVPTSAVGPAAGAARLAKPEVYYDPADPKKPPVTLPAGAKMLPPGTGKEGKMLPPASILAVEAGQSVSQMLPDLRKNMEINKDLFGPLVGGIGGRNPWDSRSQILQAKIKMASQEFGKFMEDGVLRKEDEAKYEKMFPQLGDTFEVALAKLASVQERLAQKAASQKSTLGESGYDVSGLKDVSVGEVVQRTLKDGTKVNVRQLPNGKWERVP